MAKAKAPKAALLIHPAKGSLAPLAFASLSKLLDIDVQFRAIDVPAGKLKEALEKLQKDGYQGAVLGSPHRRAGGTGTLSGEAKAIGAVSCLTLGGSMKSHNTDATGFYDVISETGFKPRNSTCQIIGAGGTARAIAYAMGRAGAKEVRVWSRRKGAADALINDVAPNWPETKFSAGPFGPAETWINTSPVDKPPMKAMPGAAIVMDLMFGPTKFLELGRAAKARSLDGTHAMVYQAIRSWEFWFGPVGGPGRAVLKADVMRVRRWR